MVSLSVVSEIAIVPDSECRTPTLIVSCAVTGVIAPVTNAAASPRPAAMRDTPVN